MKTILAFGDSAPQYLQDMNWLKTAGRQDSRPRTPVLEIDNLIALRKICEGGAGLAILPDYIVDHSHKLVQLLQSADVPSFDTYFCYPQSMRGSAKLTAFRDFLVSKSRNWDY